MRMLAAALIATLFGGPAWAEFRLVEQKDGFDGSTQKLISIDRASSHGSMNMYTRNNRPLDAKSYRIAWNPLGQNYICGDGLDDRIYVRWLHVDDAGNITHKGLSPIYFDVRSDKSTIDLNTTPYLQNWDEVAAFLDRMMQPGAVRLTYTDACGEKVLEEISTKGFSEARLNY